MLKTVAVGTDGSDTAAQAVELAIDLAQRYQARLVVISAYRPVDEGRVSKQQEDAPQELQWAINPDQEVEALLSTVESQAHAAGLEVTSVASRGDPADVLLRFASEQGADLLVVGNKGMRRRLLGSVPNSVAHRADCSVLIARTT